MRQLVVLSGKGGTGKTSITAGLAVLAAREGPLRLVDADADAANLALVLRGETEAVAPFFGADLAVVDAERCFGCLACVDVCRAGAITPDLPVVVDPVACEGCHACALECPDEAIRMASTRAGTELRTQSAAGPLFHGDLDAGQENSGKLVAALRARARETNGRDADLILIDGPPGIACPAIAASTGADLALLVTEPSVSALHDLERILDTLDGLGVPAVACLNKADLEPAVADRIRAFLGSRDVPLVGEIPYAGTMRRAVDEGRPATTFGDPDLDGRFERIWAGVRDALDATVRTRPA